MGGEWNPAEACPCCGGKATVKREKGRHGIASPSLWYRETVKCRKCGLTVTGKRPNEGVQLWNRRASPPAPSGSAWGVKVKPLEWQDTFVDRGDGASECNGCEADSGFGWYSIEMYFGSDSYGWQVKFDCEVIADTDDPDGAKAKAQSHFEQRIMSALTPSPSYAEGVAERDAMRDLLFDLRARLEPTSAQFWGMPALIKEIDDVLAGKTRPMPLGFRAGLEVAARHVSTHVGSPFYADEANAEDAAEAIRALDGKMLAGDGS